MSVLFPPSDEDDDILENMPTMKFRMRMQNRDVFYIACEEVQGSDRLYARHQS